MTIYGYARVSTDGQSLASQEPSSKLQAAPRSLPRKSVALVVIVPNWQKR
jgi:hypothetical protein